MRSTQIGLLQLEPVFKQPAASIERADQLIASLSHGELDLLILPELAFTGYNFRSFDDIEPFLESEVDGLSVGWAKRTAQRLDCHVMIGFPQRIQEDGVRECFNALAIVSNVGQIVKVYHKTQLYPPVDPLWARAGEGFLALDLAIGRRDGERGELVRCSIGICMDLSPDKFEAPFDAYELSSFAVTQRSELLICSMAWLDSVAPPDPNRTPNGKTWEEVGPALNYWAMRCEPLWKQKYQSFVACNRVGKEDDTIYTGTSCVISNSDNPYREQSGQPTVLAYASKHQPELLVVKVPLCPS